MNNSERSWDSSRDKFDSEATAARLRRPMPIMDQTLRRSTDTDCQASDEHSKWLSWYLGAPGTLVGTVIGFCLVEGIRSLPVVISYNARHPYILGDNVHKFGLLYFRALLCVTLPLAFLNVALCVADMVTSKRIFKIRWKLFGLTLFTTFLAIIQAILWAYLFAENFNGPQYIYDGVAGSSEPRVLFECPKINDNTSILMADNKTKSLRCIHAWDGPSLSNGTFIDPREFLLNESYISLKHRTTARDLVYFPSNMAEIMNTVYHIAPENLIDIFQESNVVGLVLLAIILGCAAGISSKQGLSAQSGASMIQIMRELHAILKTMMTYVISVTPVAIIPLFSGPVLAGIQTAEDDLPRLCYFILALIGACATHMFVVLPLLLYLFTWRNPFKYLFQTKDSLIYAFSCSSSSKSLPLALRLADGSDGDRNVFRLSASIGTGINKNGAAIYIVLALMWTFRNAGLYAELTFLKQSLICVNALIASTAVAPVRTGGIAIVLSIFATLTRLEIPYSLSFMLVAECIIDPFSTVINLWGNLVVSRIISHRKE